MWRERNRGTGGADVNLDADRRVANEVVGYAGVESSVCQLKRGNHQLGGDCVPVYVSLFSCKEKTERTVFKSVACSHLIKTWEGNPKGGIVPVCFHKTDAESSAYTTLSTPRAGSQQFNGW